MNQKDQKTVFEVVSHLKNGEAVPPGKILNYEISKLLIKQIGLDRLLSVYIPVIDKGVR